MKQAAFLAIFMLSLLNYLLGQVAFPVDSSKKEVKLLITDLRGRHLEADIELFEKNHEWYAAKFNTSTTHISITDNKFALLQASKKGYFPNYLTKSEIINGFNDTVLALHKVMKDSVCCFKNAGLGLEDVVFVLYYFLKRQPRVKVELLGTYDGLKSHYDRPFLDNFKKELVKKGIFEYRILIATERELPSNQLNVIYDGILIRALSNGD